VDKRFEGKSVFLTGAGRGQGRSHAVHFAREGADLAISDICRDVATVPYGLSREDDLAETKRLCEAEGARVISDRVDVRDYEQVATFANRALEELGRIDVLVANAGIFTFGTLTELSSEQFGDMIDTNLKGPWHTVKAVVPSMAERGYGRIVIIGSSASLIGYPNVGHYVAAKHGVLGLTKSLALEQAANGITANCVCPTGVHTQMLENEAAYALMSPDNPTLEGALVALQSMNAIPRPWLEPEEVSKLVLFLASDEASSITGAEFKIDMGLTAI
jgi:SDR family mycofactocin-dependent oxidoreductase